MQQELDDSYPDLPIHILAINGSGHESGNDDIASDGDLPVLQDTATDNVWGAWEATWRDVTVVDGENQVVWTVNLTGHDLARDEYYAELLTVFVETAEAL